MIPKTMAMKITRENAPVAMAIMPNWFLLTPMQDIIGKYLVINEMGAWGDQANNQPLVTFTHTTYVEEEFNKFYTFVRTEMSNQFVEVDHTGEN